MRILFFSIKNFKKILHFIQPRNIELFSTSEDAFQQFASLEGKKALPRKIKVMLWNMAKGIDPQCLPDLKVLSKGHQIILLQEYKMKKDQSNDIFPQFEFSFGGHFSDGEGGKFFLRSECSKRIE